MKYNDIMIKKDNNTFTMVGLKDIPSKVVKVLYDNGVRTYGDLVNKSIIDLPIDLGYIYAIRDKYPYKNHTKDVMKVNIERLHLEKRVYTLLKDLNIHYVNEIFDNIIVLIESLPMEDYSIMHIAIKDLYAKNKFDDQRYSLHALAELFNTIERSDNENQIENITQRIYETLVLYYDYYSEKDLLSDNEIYSMFPSVEYNMYRIGFDSNARETLKEIYKVFSKDIRDIY